MLMIISLYVLVSHTLGTKVMVMLNCGSEGVGEETGGEWGRNKHECTHTYTHTHTHTHTHVHMHTYVRIYTCTYVHSLYIQYIRMYV